MAKRLPTCCPNRSSPSKRATTTTPSTGSTTAVARKPSMAGRVWLPAFCPRKGGKMRFPAPKNRENSIKLTSSILFLLNFMSILLVFFKISAKKDPSQIPLRRVLLYNTRGTTQIARRKTSCHFRLYQALCTHVAYTESPTDRCVGGLGSEGIRVLALSAGLPPSPALYATCCQLRLRHRF